MNDNLGNLSDFHGNLNDFHGNLNVVLGKNNNFYCTMCDIKFNSNYHYDRHLLTNKHIKKEKYFKSNGEKIKNLQYDCSCGKNYKYRQGLYNHKKKCSYSYKEKESPIDPLLQTSSIIPPIVYDIDMVKELIKQHQYIVMENQEFKKMLMELATKPTTTNITNMNTNTNTNSHNKQFNLNFFLNETCKDAMNMSEFMESIAIKAEELEDMGKLGYIRGISNIFIRALNELDETKRPIHCTDIKREILYIKDNNVWTKETSDNLKIKKTITYIADKNFRRIPKWRLDNPDSDDILSKKNTDFMVMLSQVMTGITPDDDIGINKIIRNVAHHVYLDKKGL